MAKKKVSGLSDNISMIVTLALVAGVGWLGYEAYQFITTTLASTFKNIFTLGGGALVQTPLGPVGITSQGGQIPGSGPGVAAGNEPIMQTNVQALQWLTSYNTTRGASPTDCLSPAVYNAAPGNVLIGSGDAQSLYNFVHSAAGTWFTVGNFDGLLAKFQNVCANQADVSYVASLFQTNDGSDLFTYITQGNTFGNGMNSPTYDNLTSVWDFCVWALALPASGTES
jgi:hypothetical protein